LKEGQNGVDVIGTASRTPANLPECKMADIGG
jgi:hypothetical protein